MMLEPRWLAWLKARVGGYFWIPCPVCKEHFAGFEASGETVNHRIERGEHVSETTCRKPACIAEGKAQREKFWSAVRDDRRGRVIRIRP